MLILKVTERTIDNTKSRHFFRKRKNNVNSEDFKRSSLKVMGTNVVVLETYSDKLECEDMERLIKAYEGRILLPENSNITLPEEVLFNPKRYYMRAVLSSLINQIRTVHGDWRRICIKIDEFEPFKELYKVVEISKSLCLLTKRNSGVNKFVDACYNEYGAVVSVKENIEPSFWNVFLDLEKTDKRGRLIVEENGVPLVLYPDAAYFENKEEYRAVLNYGVEHKTVCAAFSDK